MLLGCISWHPSKLSTTGCTTRATGGCTTIAFWTSKVAKRHPALWESDSILAKAAFTNWWFIIGGSPRCEQGWAQSFWIWIWIWQAEIRHQSLLLIFLFFCLLLLLLLCLHIGSLRLLLFLILVFLLLLILLAHWMNQIGCQASTWTWAYYTERNNKIPIDTSIMVYELPKLNINRKRNLVLSSFMNSLQFMSRTRSVWHRPQLQTWTRWVVAGMGTITL